MSPATSRALGAALAALALVGRALAAEPPEGDPPDGSGPGDSHRLRAASETGIYLGLQLSTYLWRPSASAVGGPGQRYGPWEKLSGRALSLDANSLETNFVGHPVMGATLYQMARGNGLSAWEASLWAVAGSAAWELVEYREKASINDLVVTPLAGIALGEPLFQLGGYLDRSPRTPGRALLGWVTSPWKKLHDAIDGARPQRGDPDDRLAYRLAAGAGGSASAAGRRSELVLALGWRLSRDREEAGVWWLGDGAGTGLDLAAALTPDRVDDFRLDSRVLLVARRSVARPESGAAGPGAVWVAGAGLAFRSRFHAWSRGGPTDALALVEAPHLSTRATWRAGELGMAAGLEAGLSFGGVRSFALDGEPGAVPPIALPSVQRAFGYHFAIGLAAAPALELSWGRWSMAGHYRWEGLAAVLRPDPTPGSHPAARLDERLTEAGARLGLRLGAGLEVGLSLAERTRWSRADAVVRRASERSAALTLALVEGP